LSTKYYAACYVSLAGARFMLRLTDSEPLAHIAKHGVAITTDGYVSGDNPHDAIRKAFHRHRVIATGVIPIEVICVGETGREEVGRITWPLTLKVGDLNHEAIFAPPDLIEYSPDGNVRLKAKEDTGRSRIDSTDEWRVG
jgi:hypothetical protein